MSLNFDEIDAGGVTTANGFRAAAVAADVKGNGGSRLDVALLVSDVNCNAAALFTSNLVKAAPIIYSEEILSCDYNIFGIFANSGNANACNGEAGLCACRDIVEKVSANLKLPPNSLLAASTGVIGSKLPKDRIIAQIPRLCSLLDDDGGTDFAKAIMTTDTVFKQAAILVHANDGDFVIGGTCKGAGMLEPSVATMLSFITTDAVIEKDVLATTIHSVAEYSFNAITVDGDTSTNDSVFILANGMSGIKPSKELFQNALGYLCLKLAKMLVRDGEGATKLVTITVKGAATLIEAKQCAKKISNSPLVKTMFAGADPNWGRLMASAGASGTRFDPAKTEIYFNNIRYVANGLVCEEIPESQVREIMLSDEFEVVMDLHEGSFSFSAYTCDFTEKYVEINADYRS
jgi:glutamate N-acetyltransferase/amino-acid N-acetyltransferase